MTADVSLNDVVVTYPPEMEAAGYRTHPGRGYTAFCLEPSCSSPEGVGWYGVTHVIGMETAPNAAALDDAWAHDQMHHDGEHPGSNIYT